MVEPKIIATGLTNDQLFKWMGDKVQSANLLRSAIAEKQSLEKDLKNVESHIVELSEKTAIALMNDNCGAETHTGELAVDSALSAEGCENDMSLRKAWAVEVLDEHGVVVWDWNAANGIDTSGNAWRNGGHRLIAAVVYCLSSASLQAEKMPDDPQWVYPFDLTKGTFHLCGKQIALGEAPLTQACASQHTTQLRSNTADR